MLIKKYTTDWVTHFKQLKTEIEQGLPGIIYQIEHVGSTAVPNLDSKPIIDIDIIYTSESDFKKIKSGLLNIGYYHNGNQGIENREVFKRTGEVSDSILDCIAHHLYVCPHNSEALERHILMRNFLIKNSEARETYQKMKYDIAAKANQKQKVYAVLKGQTVNSFIDNIIVIEKLNMQRDSQISNDSFY